MGYEVHIERRVEDGSVVPIPLVEWTHAVEETEGVRLAGEDLRTSVPRSEEQLVMSRREGDAEVFFPQVDDWHLVFMWTSRGTVLFSGNPEFLNEDSEVRRVGRELAGRLGAVVIGDSGERYE